MNISIVSLTDDYRDDHALSLVKEYVMLSLMSLVAHDCRSLFRFL